MKPGFDPLLQAYGGMMSVTGRAGGSADLLRRLDQRQGDRHVLHHRRTGRAPHARQDGQGLPGRHLAVRLGGALGRGSVNSYLASGDRAQAARHRRRRDRALPALRHGRPAGLPGARQRPAVGALRAGAGPSRMGDRSALRQERGAGAQQGRAAAPDRGRHARPAARRLARGLRQGRRAVQPGQRHRRAGGDRAARRGRPGASAAGATGRRRARAWSACRSPSTTSARIRCVRRRSSGSIRRKCWRKCRAGSGSRPDVRI